MKVVVVATRADAPAEDFAPHMEAESKMALGMFAEDFIREIYSRKDGMGAVLVMEADSEDAVKARLDQLPLVKAGLLTYEIYAVGPYRGIVAAANA
jgi:hypothetical protein